MNKRLLGRWSAILLLVVAVSIALLAWLPQHGLRFDSATWKRDNWAAFKQKSHQELLEATRDRMVNDFLKRHQLAGMRRADLTSFLGDPDLVREQPFKDWDLIYWLGPDDRGAFGHLDLKWLVLRLDAAGNVTEYKVTVD